MAEFTWPSAATAPFWPVDCEPVWTAFAARQVAEAAAAFPALLPAFPALLALPALFPFRLPPLFCRRSSARDGLWVWTEKASAAAARPKRAVTAFFINMLGKGSGDVDRSSRRN